MKFLYCVYDRKAKAYGPLTAYRNDTVAIRDFSQVVADKDSIISKYPEDFELHKLGTFVDDPAGTPEGELPDFVITGDKTSLVVSGVSVKALEGSEDAAR